MKITERCEHYFGDVTLSQIAKCIGHSDKASVRVIVTDVIRSGSHVRLQVSGLEQAHHAVPILSNNLIPTTVAEPGPDFDVALVIPTGLGASIGGKAGDAGPTAKLLASVCDHLVLHPNVVNASDINEMPDNALYVEGHALTEYLMGNIGLQPVRQNRVLVVIDGSAEPRYVKMAINSVNAARATYGLDCPEIVVLDRPFVMESKFTSTGRAIGQIKDLLGLFDVLSERSGRYDAVAITSLIKVDPEVRDNYYNMGGVNPWGGVEAMLTHAVSHCFMVPCAHAPMMDSWEVEELDYGIVDPCDAAEVVSLTFFQSVLKGLHKAPQLVGHSHDVSCLVIPKFCLGLAHLAAHERGIPIIAVDNKLTVPSVDCTKYVDAITASSYLEAAGMISAMKAGVSIESLHRPLETAKVSWSKQKCMGLTETKVEVKGNIGVESPC